MIKVSLRALVVALIVTAAVLMAGDTFVIPNIMRPLFKHYLGPQMLDELRLFPAALFYLIHIGGLYYLAALPALKSGSGKIALINGSVLGFVAYACYEMTSWTIMTAWHLNLVLVDVAWGTLISGLAAWCGAMAGRKWQGRTK